MKGMLKGVAALALSTALFASAAQAQTPVSFGLGGGVTLPLGDFGDAAKTGFHGTGLVEFQPASLPVGIRLDGTFHRIGFSDLQEDFAGEGNFQMITGTLNGVYTFQNLAPGRYQVLVTASGFAVVTSDPMFVGAGERVTSDVTLRVGAIEQAVLVTAAADTVSAAQTGASVTVIDQATLDALNKTELSEVLRLVPGSHVVPTGGRGGVTNMFIRGGNSNFNKVLVDGIAVNDIGGAFDFGQLSTGGVEQ